MWAYVGLFGLAVALETLIYRWTLGVPYGRMSIISRYHFGASKLKKSVQSVGELFERYGQPQPGFRELFSGHCS